MQLEPFPTSLYIAAPLHPTIHNPHSHTPFPVRRLNRQHVKKTATVIATLASNNLKFNHFKIYFERLHFCTYKYIDCYSFHIQINVTVVLLLFTLQMLAFYALHCWATTSHCWATRLLYLVAQWATTFQSNLASPANPFNDQPKNAAKGR